VLPTAVIDPSTAACAAGRACAAQKLQGTENHRTYQLAILTKSGGLSPSILMMQTAEYRFRNDLSCLGY
jgi:hypothetical protein